MSHRCSAALIYFCQIVKELASRITGCPQQERNTKTRWALVCLSWTDSVRSQTDEQIRSFRNVSAGPSWSSALIICRCQVLLSRRLAVMKQASGRRPPLWTVRACCFNLHQSEEWDQSADPSPAFSSGPSHECRLSPNSAGRNNVWVIWFRGWAWRYCSNINI